jgi:hypothetical protein
VEAHAKYESAAVWHPKTAIMPQANWHMLAELLPGHWVASFWHAATHWGDAAGKPPAPPAPPSVDDPPQPQSETVVIRPRLNNQKRRIFMFLACPKPPPTVP